MSHEEQAETFSKSLLIAIRKFIESTDRSYEDFPRWVRAANIRLSNVNGSTIIFFERTPKNNDSVVEYRKASSDVEFVFPQRTSHCKNCMFDLAEQDGDDLGLSSVANLSLSISNRNQCFTNLGENKNHLSLSFQNVMFQYEPEEQIEAVRYIPFALFIPSQHIYDFKYFWGNHAAFLMRTIVPPNKALSVDYRSEPMAEKGILSCIDDTVIIRGSYKEPYEDELRQIRDYLIRLGYDAFLIKDLPARDEMSLEEKIKLWTNASRFCIMVDREASGHIKEYEIVKSMRKPLILLRPEEGGSTWLIGDDEVIDLNYIRTFEFTESTLGKTEQGIQWAEDLLKERGKAYPEFYPWRSEE